MDIWEERRVFGSRAQSLREELLGKKASTRVQEAKQPSLPLYQVIHLENLTLYCDVHSDELGL